MKKNSYQELENVSRKIIAHFKMIDQSERPEESEIWGRIVREIDQKQIKVKKRKLWIYSSVSVVAACVLLLIILNKSIETNPGLDHFVSQLTEKEIAGNQIELFLSGDRSVVINGDSLNLQYTSNGRIRINDKEELISNLESNSNVYNQLVVPRGKYSRVTFADGTQVQVNSGSRLIYPQSFKKDKREIYIDGEIFLNVAHNKKKPFHVKTSQFDVEVLGTSFNVNAYRQSGHAEVVLVEGSVKLHDKHQKEIILKPDNLIAVRNGRAGEVEHVDVEDYTAWVKGLLIVNTESLLAVFEKLSRAYNIPIIVDPSLENEIIDGKFDLHQPLSELMRMLAILVPINYQEKGDRYYITPPNQ